MRPASPSRWVVLRTTRQLPLLGTLRSDTTPPHAPLVSIYRTTNSIFEKQKCITDVLKWLAQLGELAQSLLDYVCGPLVHFAVLIGVAADGTFDSLGRKAQRSLTAEHTQHLPGSTELITLRTEIQSAWNVSLFASLFVTRRSLVQIHPLFISVLFH